MSDTITKFKSINVLFLCLATATACNNYVTNNDTQLVVDVENFFPSVPTKENTVNGRLNLWWNEFERPQLNELIDQSFAHNQQLVQALATVNQARALTMQTRSQRLPQIALEASTRNQWQRSESQPGEETIAAALDWEIDVFKRIASAQQADQLEVLARIEAYQSVKLTLSAEIANAYFGAVAAHLTLKLLNSQAQLDQELLELLDLRLDNGIGTIVEVLQQQSRVAETEPFLKLQSYAFGLF